MISESQKAPKRYKYLRKDDLGNQKMKILEAKNLPNVTYIVVSVIVEAEQLPNVTYIAVLVTLGIQKAPKWYPKKLPNVVKQLK